MVRYNDALYIKELQRHLERLEEYEEIVNTSSDVCMVQIAVDKMLEILDIFNSYNEEDLNKAGLTKRYVDESKQELLDNYEIILEQAARRKYGAS